MYRKLPAKRHLFGIARAAFFAAACLFAGNTASASDDWGSIEITTDEDGELVVTLENDEIRVVYRPSSNDWAVDANGRPTCIDEFFVKAWDKDFTDGGRFDNNLEQRSMTSAQVIYDGPDRKTVYMQWESGAKEEVSIFPNSRFLQTDYIDWDFLITDWPNWPRSDQSWPEQRFAVYGAELWHRTYDPADKPTHPDGWPWDPNDPTHFPNDPNAMREWGLGYDEMYFNRIPGDAGKQGERDPADAGSLNYKGHFIIGAYKVATGQGLGRVIPVDRTKAIILWNYRSWEFAPTGSGRFTSYLYPVTEGESEIIALGKEVVDTGIPPNTLDDPPITTDDYYVLEPGETLSIDALDGVLANDIDPEGDPIIAILASDPSQGQLTFNADGSFVYVHDGTDPVADSFTYQAVDITGNAATATVFFTPPKQRISEDLVVLYLFNEFIGNIVHDVSGTGAPLDLTIANPGAVSWLPGGGLSVDGSTVISSPGPATKVIASALSTNELTVEAWVRADDFTQFGPARVVALSKDPFPSGGNFNLGQGSSSSDAANFDMRLRTSTTNQYGTPSLTTPAGAVDNTLAHIAFTRSAVGNRVLYVDGVPVTSDFVSGNFSSWDPTAILALANEPTADRGWAGELHLVAIYNRALTPGEVSHNFEAGSGTAEIEDTVPTDPDFWLQWGFNNFGQSGGTPDADIDLPEALGAIDEGEEVIVAILDTGVDYNHEDLAEHIWINSGEIPANGIDDDGNGYIDDYHGYDFYNDDADPMDDNGHGTHVAGIIGAVSNNGLGGVGVIQNVRIMPLKFQNSGNVGTIDAAIEAIEYATMMGADVINSSWLMSRAWPEGAGFSQELKDAIAAANSAGVLFVATTGNSGLNLDETPMYPAAYDNSNILAVAATDADDLLYSLSNFGPTSVDIAAPGVSIYSTVPRAGCLYCATSGYNYLTGTSFATPAVTGVAALVLSQYPNFSHLEVKSILMDSADYLPTLDGNIVSNGRLNAYNALQLAAIRAPRAPVIVPPPDQVIDEDTSTGPLEFTVTHPDSETIFVSAAIGNSAAVASVALNGTGGTRTVTVTPVPDAAGNSVIILTASDGTLASDASFSVEILPVNDAPTVSAPAPVVAGPNELVNLFGAWVNDIDASIVTVDMSVSRGTLFVADFVSSGIVAGDISGNGSGSVTLSAPIAAINTTLGSAGGLAYRGLPNLVGADTLTISANDGGATGSGGPLSALDSVVIAVEGADWYDFLAERFSEAVLANPALETSHWGFDADLNGNGIPLIDEYLFGGDDPDSATLNKNRSRIVDLVPGSEGFQSVVLSLVLSSRATGQAAITLQTQTDLSVPRGPDWDTAPMEIIATDTGPAAGTSEITVQSTDLSPEGESARYFYFDVDLDLE